MKKSVSLVCFVILICLAINMAFDSRVFAAQDRESVSILVRCEDGSIDLSNISVKVYASNLISNGEDAAITEYDETFLFEVRANEFGVITFGRPTDFFSVRFVLESLPEGYGIERSNYFFDRNCFSIFVNLDLVTDFVVEKTDEEYVISLYDENSNRLCAYTQLNDVLERSYVVDTDKKELCIEETVHVSVARKEQLYQFTESFLYKNELEKNRILFENDLLSEQDFLNRLCELYLNDETGLYQIDGTELYYLLGEYCERNSISPEDDVYITSVLDLNDGIETTSASMSRAYSENGKFCVNYDFNMGATYQMALAVANEFEKIDDFFVKHGGCADLFMILQLRIIS